MRKSLSVKLENWRSYIRDIAINLWGLDIYQYLGAQVNIHVRQEMYHGEM